MHHIELCSFEPMKHNFTFINFKFGLKRNQLIKGIIIFELPQEIVGDAEFVGGEDIGCRQHKK